LDFALTQHEVARAQELLARADQKRVFSSPIRRRWRRYLEARIRQLSGAPPLTSTELYEFLADSNDLSSTSGIRDCEIVILCVELVAQGRRSEAREKLSSFLSWRRRYSRAVLPTQLRNVIVECGLADALEERAASPEPSRHPSQILLDSTTGAGCDSE
jgi:hypothetical protein